MRMGKWDIAFVCAVLGTIMVLAVSILLDSAKGAGRWLRYMGINSLFIMATHIDFRVNVFVHWILSKLGLMTYRYVAFIQIVLLCLIECILCRLCSPWVDKVINRMMKKLMIERICDEH